MMDYQKLADAVDAAMKRISLELAEWEASLSLASDAPCGNETLPPCPSCGKTTPLGHAGCNANLIGCGARSHLEGAECVNRSDGGRFVGSLCAPLGEGARRGPAAATPRSSGRVRLRPRHREWLLLDAVKPSTVWKNGPANPPPLAAVLRDLEQAVTSVPPPARCAKCGADPNYSAWGESTGHCLDCSPPMRFDGLSPEMMADAERIKANDRAAIPDPFGARGWINRGGCA